MQTVIGPNEIFRPRVSRVIAVARAAFAAFSLFSIWLDPSQPAAYPQAAYYLLAVYTVYAVAVAYVHIAHPSWALAWSKTGLVIDVSVFSVLMFLTEGPTSPFYIWFNFVLVSAAISGGWRLSALMSAALILLYLALTFAFYFLTPHTGEVELDRILIRSGYLAVIGLLLAYFFREQERIAREFARVLNWSNRSSSSLDPLEESLAHAAAVFQAEAVVLLWAEIDEPLLNYSAYSRELESGRAPPDLLEELAGIGSSFIVNRDGRVLRMDGDTVRGAAELPLPEFVETRASGRFLLCRRVESDQVEGALLVFRRTPFTPEELTLSALISTQVAVGLQRTMAVNTWREALTVEDRLRLARDLHDGILQSLAGTALQLNRLADDRSADLSTFRQRVEMLEVLMVDEQRQLRQFIDDLRPGTALRVDKNFEIADDLRELAQRLEQQWGISIEVEVHPPEASGARRFQFDLHQILREAVANAVRHGSARSVAINISVDETALRLAIKDDGCGLAHHGCFDAGQDVGSRSLRDRVSKLEGQISMTSQPAGLLIDIKLPRNLVAC